MKIVIAGGTGLIGSHLYNQFCESNHQVFIVSRKQGHVTWNSADLIAVLESSDILINLAGKSINCRHTKSNKKQILDSRINSTKQLGDAVLACKIPPKLWINASAAAIYSPKLNNPATENSTDFSTDFLSQVVSKWENAFFGFKLPQTRQVALRTSVVLSNSGGAFVPLYWLAKFGLGGTQGSGKQYFSWIHMEDYYRIILFLSTNSLSGVVNCTSPDPVTNSQFMKTLRSSIGMKTGLPAPEILVKIGAFVIGTENSLLLNSSFLYPEVLIKSGFEFKFPFVKNAVDDLIKSRKS